MWPFMKFRGQHFESVASLILRVPGLFILDYWWLHDSNNPSWTSTSARSAGGDQLSMNNGGGANRWTEDVVGAALVTLMPLQGLLLLMLSLERLVDLYMNYISAILLVTAHLFSQYYISTEQHWSSKSPLGLADYLQQQEVRADQHHDPIHAIFGLNVVSSFSSSPSSSSSSSSSIDQNFLKRQLVALVVHVAIASAVAFLLDLHQTSQRMMLAAYTLPVVARLSGLLPVAQQDLQSVHNLATAAIILQVIYYVLKYVPSVVQASRNVFVRLARSVWSHGGTALGLAASTFGSLFVPLHFVVFWMLHVTAYLYYHLVVRQRAHGEWCLVLLRCVSDVCASPISLAGTAVSVSYVSYALLTATKFYLQGYRAFVLDNVMHSGWTEGLTMVLIAVQTGLIELRMPHRAAVMAILLFIVVSSIFQSMFEIAEPHLLELSTSRAGNLAKHVRTLALCAFLFAFPLYMTYVLCAIFPVDFWMLVVIASCVMTSVQVLGLLAVYVLFTYDSFRTEPWDGLDDVVYYARALTRVLEFIVAVFVVGAGVRESIAGNWSWINSSVLLVHCYFNVWQRLQAGWNSFLLRREAVRKIRSLPMATSEELASYGDVCSICYGEMKQSSGSHSPFSFSPVIVLLSCRHAYHAGCLRKWLYVQDKCPLCQAVIRQPTTTTTNQ